MSSRRNKSRSGTVRGSSPHPFFTIGSSKKSPSIATDPAASQLTMQLQQASPKQEKDKGRDDRHHGSEGDIWRDSPYGTGVERIRMQLPEVRWKPRSASHSQLPEIVSPNVSQLDTSGLSSHLEVDSEVFADPHDDSMSFFTARPGTSQTGRSSSFLKHDTSRDRSLGRKDRLLRERHTDGGRLFPDQQFGSSNQAEHDRSPSPSPSRQGGGGGSKDAWDRASTSGSQTAMRMNRGRKHFMDKIRRYHRVPLTTQLRRTPSSSTTLDDPRADDTFSTMWDDAPKGRRTRTGSTESAAGSPSMDNGLRKDGRYVPPGKMRHPRFPFAGHEKDRRPTAVATPIEIQGPEPVWKLDTDLSNVSDIVQQPRPVSPTDTHHEPEDAGLQQHQPHHQQQSQQQQPQPHQHQHQQPQQATEAEASGQIAKGSWFAPESWAVKKPSEDHGVLPGGRELAQGQVDDKGKPYCLRIYRSDSGFTTISATLSTTVTQILEILARKSFLQEELENYEIVMWKNDLSRTLDHRERPLLKQKRLLQQAGYQLSDRIEDIGREDNSYLVRFTFLQTKFGGYSSRNQEPAFDKNQKFNHVDLEGRSLITIPIALYTHSAEIQTLNLSRNLALDVPTDFLQRCANLRELKYVSCEAVKLPLSFSMAPRLTFLDISNNQIRDLEHAQLNGLRTLVSLKMANNKLTSLPDYFAEIHSLRSLNISSNSFTEFPRVLIKVSSLLELDISFNKITEVPSLGTLTSLERLWITNNSLRGKLPQEFRNLVNLREIDARFNEITSIDNLSTLPRLEQLFVGHNAITQFVGSFPKLQLLYMDHCPITIFEITESMPSLSILNLASAKLAQLKEDLFAHVPNLTKLMLNKNRLTVLSPHIGCLSRLEYLSMVENRLTELPPTIGCLTSLRYLNLRECNLQDLPGEIWYCCSLETLNLSTNVLVSFPKLPPTGPPHPPACHTQHNTPQLSFEELGKLEDFENRRPSQTSGGTYAGTLPLPTSHRNSSITSMPLPMRKASASSRAATDPLSASRKDSVFSQRMLMTFAGSLRYLSLADNRLDDDMFQQLALLSELRVLNLSYNELTEFPPGLLRRWRTLSELYLSGNELSALPADDFDESSFLSILHLNANKFQSLPSELTRARSLAVLDVGSNALKYNVSNWRYEWNWTWNDRLRYLNFSGNNRFEIKPHTAYTTAVGSVDGQDVTKFTNLSELRILGLIDVTLTTNTIPDETEDRRVRTSASLSEAITYGMADTLGKNEHLSMIDMVVPRFRGNEMETVLALFDGRALPDRGSRITKYLHEHFSAAFIEELKRLKEDEDAQDALRRCFLSLNKDMAVSAFKSVHDDGSSSLLKKDESTHIDQDDINAGAVATVLYMNGSDLFVANVGNTEAIVVSSNGTFRHLTKKHDPAETTERERIREAGGYVSRNGRLNDQLSVSRAFGFFHLLPAIIAAPSTLKETLTDQDEMVIIATSELWDYISPEVVADVARAERGDLMLASQKLRDLAMAYGSTSKIMVMIAGVSDLRNREKQRCKGPNLAMRPSPSSDHIFPTAKRNKRGRDAPTDSRLARYDRVEAPTGALAIIFTDIKGSTSLWESNAPAMETAIQIHNELFRRQLGIMGGYEAKTEGDAFMVSFSTATAALLWTFSCQIALLSQAWPTEILESQPGEEEYDSDHNLIYRGLSVRMGIHWGRPVCARDPVTSRMDYFGPMVNRAARICGAADGGQILVSADFISEINHDLDMFAGQERNNSTGSEDTHIDDSTRTNIYRELTELSSKGFGVQAWGETKLKGLENPEMLYSVYPYSLSGRLEHQQKANTNSTPKDKEIHFDEDILWGLWHVVLRVEKLCSALECGSDHIPPVDTGLINLVKEEYHNYPMGRVMTMMDHLVTRLESAASVLYMRHLLLPFRSGEGLAKYGVSMVDVFKELSKELHECRQLKAKLKAPHPAKRRSVHPSPLAVASAGGQDDPDLRSSLDPVQIAPDVESDVEEVAE
ncbi:cysteinyl-tRNA synthetase [Ascosphaera acerosa]|nr:cysteinyl-tRNA synthetase [Ascosphaera acerosa]